MKKFIHFLVFSVHVVVCSGSKTLANPIYDLSTRAAAEVTDVSSDEQGTVQLNAS